MIRSRNAASAARRTRTPCSPTISDYLTAKAKKVTPKTLQALTRYLLTGPAFKPLHAMPLDKVSRKDVASRIVAVERDASSIVAAKSRIALMTFYVWALRMGLVEAESGGRRHSARG